MTTLAAPGSVARTCDQAAPTDPASDERYVCGVKGTKLGGKVGVGFHSFFGQTVALGVELEDSSDLVEFALDVP